MTPTRLVEELAEWVRVTSSASAGTLGRSGALIGFDGPTEIGTTTLADQVGEALRWSGHPVIRVTTSWWYRPSALRLELGRHNVDMLIGGWVDADALRRELVEPLAKGLPVITQLRNPDTDRSVRQHAETLPTGGIVLIDGPFLLAADLPLDALVGFNIGTGTLRRAMPADRAWWLPAFERYRDEYQSAERSDVVLSYDHASAPAASGLPVSASRIHLGVTDRPAPR